MILFSLLSICALTSNSISLYIGQTKFDVGVNCVASNIVIHSKCLSEFYITLHMFLVNLLSHMLLIPFPVTCMYVCGYHEVNPL